MFAAALVGTSRSAALACLIGITLAAPEAKLGPLVQLVSKQNRRRNKVKRQRRFGTEVEAASTAAAQIKTLIDSLSRCQQSLDCDIATEEERTRCSDVSSHFVIFMTAPIASGWSGCRVGLAPTGKRRLVTAHAKKMG
jgi:hypothetical protein